MQVAECIRSFNVAGMYVSCTLYENFCCSRFLFISWFNFYVWLFPFDSSCCRRLFEFSTRRFLVCLPFGPSFSRVYTFKRALVCVCVCSPIVFHRFLISQTNIKLKIHIVKWMWIVKMPSHFSTFYLYRPLCLVLLLWLKFSFSLTLFCLPSMCSVWSFAKRTGTHYTYTCIRSKRAHRICFNKVETFVSFDRYWSLTPPTKCISIVPHCEFICNDSLEFTPIYLLKTLICSPLKMNCFLFFALKTFFERNYFHYRNLSMKKKIKQRESENAQATSLFYDCACIREQTQATKKKKCTQCESESRSAGERMGDRTRGGVSVMRVVRFVPLFGFVVQKAFSLSIAW